jgi:hypothetical protein
LVVPASYHITRYAATEPPERAYRPIAFIYGLLDPDPAKNRYVFQATLQPAIPYHLRRQLIDALVPYSPAGHEPQLVFPTDSSVQATTSYSWGADIGLDQPQTLQLWDGFQVTLSTPLSNALLIKAAIDSSGITGKVTFSLPDGLTASSQLVLDTAITGPWEGGPVAVTLGSGKATLVNRIETAVNVAELATRQSSSPVTHIPVNATLPPAGTQQVALSAPASEAYAAAVPASAHVPFSELDVFVEDVTTHVIFMNLVSYANHQLSGLHGQMKLQGTDHLYEVPLAEGQPATVDLSLPLTTYLERQAIQFQIVKTLTSGHTATTAWIPWDLSAKGNIVNLTWDLIQ